MDRHATPAQSARLAETIVQPTNLLRLSRVQHAAERRAHATSAPLPPTARASRATGQPASAALQGSGSGSGSEQMPPPAAGPNSDRRLVASPPLSNSSRRRSRTCIGRPTGPSHAASMSVPRRCSRTDSPGQAGKGCRADAVEQASWDKVRLANRPGVRWVQAAEHRACAANTPPPPAAHTSRATGQTTAAAALQGSGSGSEPMPPTAGPNQDGVSSGRRHLQAAAGVEAAPVRTSPPVRVAP